VRLLERQAAVGVAHRQKAAQLPARPQNPAHFIAAADHIDVVQRCEARGTEKVHEPEVEHEALRPADPALDVACQRVAVGCVDIAFDGDEQGGRRSIACGEHRAPAFLAKIVCFWIYPEHSAGAHIGHVTSLSRTWRRCGWLLTQPDQQITTESVVRR